MDLSLETMEVVMIDPAKLTIDSELIRFEAACSALGISVRTARRYVEDPEKDFPRPFTIAGRQQWLRRSDIAAFIERRAGTVNKPASRAAATHAGHEDVAA